MSKSVSILGCGWLGLPLAESLVQAGYHIKGSTTHADKAVLLQAKGIHPYVIDLSSSTAFTGAADFFDTDILVVLVPPRSKTQNPGVYLSQMQQLAEVIVLYPRIQQLLYTSSTSVYPDRSGLVKEEEISLPEQSAHSELVAVENIFLSVLNLSVTIARLGGLTGGSRLLVRHFAGKKELSGGYYPVNLLHQQDAVNSIRFLLEKRLTGVFNVCSPEHPYKKDFYTRLAKRFHMALPEFKEEDQQEGKTINVSKLEKAGYLFSYRTPDSYTYDEHLQ
ncbi:MAG: nucleoside-diphosphate sugar epimerase [Cytophagaceae bacterium]|nr:nucleoside-diphosphate sugar epimerase [Cytophagaceae bacterium]